MLKREALGILGNRNLARKVDHKITLTRGILRMKKKMRGEGKGLGILGILTKQVSRKKRGVVIAISLRMISGGAVGTRVGVRKGNLGLATLGCLIVRIWGF